MYICEKGQRKAKLPFQWILVFNCVKHSFSCGYRWAALFSPENTGRFRRNPSQVLPKIVAPEIPQNYQGEYLRWSFCKFTCCEHVTFLQVQSNKGPQVLTIKPSPGFKMNESRYITYLWSADLSKSSSQLIVSILLAFLNQ